MPFSVLKQFVIYKNNIKSGRKPAVYCVGTLRYYDNAHLWTTQG